MDQRLDLESGTIHDLNKPVPGMWRFPKDHPALCCIYRVPNCMRQVNPEAYTPQILLIGPLHHSLKSQALKSRGDMTDTKSMDYLNMERHKKIYLAEFKKRVGGENSIEGFTRTIEEDEEMIRESYSESTAWIESPEFVEMILHDSVFILEFMLRNYEIDRSQKTGDPLMDEPCQGAMVRRDLGLLENQLPYFLLDKLFEPIIHTLADITFRELVMYIFDFTDKIGDDSKFRHFTDLSRCVLVETLPGNYITHEKIPELNEKYHAYKLHKGGVTFNAVDEELSLDVLSLDVEFKNGCLNIPSFFVDGLSEMKLRNMMALEQCHYANNTHVCDYIFFMDSLIDTEEDVALLVEKGIIKHFLGDIGSVATMVNRLSLGVLNFGSHYSVITKDVNSYYHNSWNKSRAVLKTVYFNNPWRGTATVAATLLLLLTLIQTMTSVMQVLPKK